MRYVYIVTRGWQYEGDDTLFVASSLESALRFCREHEAKGEWNPWGDGGGIVRYPINSETPDREYNVNGELWRS